MQSFKCRIKGHAPGDRIVRNGGRAFATCLNCGADLIEKDGKWSTPPKGVRIVWAPAAAREAEAPESGSEEQREAADGDRRAGADRRKARGPLPGFLRGKDRRSGQRDRRTAFGRRFRG